MYRTSCPRSNLLGATGLCNDYSLELMSVSLAVALVALGGVALSLEAAELGKQLSVVTLIAGLCWHVGRRGRNAKLLKCSRRPLLMDCPMSHTTFIKKKTKFYIII